jgi:crossover junction endodeoxyribonuclease RuvC
MSGQRILGIDPGLRITGFGVIEKHGNQLRYVASGCIKSNDKQSLPERIATLFAGISEVIATYRPDQAAVEKVFVNVNPQSTLLLGQARGAAISALVHGGLPVANTPPCRSSRRWSATARRPRSRCRTWSSSCCRWPAPSADAADALACAICHATAGRAWGCWRRPGIAFAAAA